MRRILVVLLLWSAVALCQTDAPVAKPALVNRNQQAKDLLDHAISDRNPDTRKQAAIALSLIGSHDTYASRLESLIDDKDVQVRLAAIASLTDIKNTRTIPVLHKAINDD